MGSVRRGVLALAIATGLAGVPTTFGAEPVASLHGACYCKIEQNLQCLGQTTRAECDHRCELCDDWFWLERRACWEWGYGG